MRRTVLLALSLLLAPFEGPSPTMAQAQSGTQKLPLTINSPDKSELLPVISADGKTLYFTRTRLGLDSSMVFDIWMSKALGDTGFSKAEFVGDNLASSNGVAVT